MPYTLISVTYDGRVHHARGFETLRMCQEARSIALTGLTIAENVERIAAVKRDEDARRNWEQKYLLDLWRCRFPPRRPSPEEAYRLQRLVLAWSAPAAEDERFHLPGTTVTMRWVKSTLGADGMVYDWPAEYGRTWHSGSGGWLWPGNREPDPGAIKHAVCVIEMPDAPGEAVPVAA